MQKKLFKLAVFIGLISLLILPAATFAQTDDDEWLTLTEFGESTCLPTAPLQATVARIINAALGLLGLVAVVIILIGGFKWMTAMGNDDNVKKAKALIIQGVIGLIIVVCAYAIAQFVLSAIKNAAQAT
jgi:uncharacterized membrane protein YjgN (DUF898 family)